MIFRFLPLTIILLTTYCAFSQDSAEQPDIKRNTVFIEGGYRSGYTLNYDRILIVKGKWKASARGGFGFYYNPYDTYIPANYLSFESYQLSLPLGINILYGKKASHLEIGLNVNFAFRHINKSYYITDYSLASTYIYSEVETEYFLNSYLSGISIGYRYQRAIGGIFFSGGIKPDFSNLNNRSYNFIENILPYANLGYTF